MNGSANRLKRTGALLMVGVGLLGGILLIGRNEIGGVAAAVVATTPPLASPVASPPSATARPSYPGVPAIHPSQPNAGPQTPAFTNQDVLDYLKPLLASGSPGSPPASIAAIEFRSAQDVEAQFDTTTGQPGDELLCVVTLHGHFEKMLPNQSQPLVGNTMYYVFNAHTGNLVLRSLKLDPSS